MGIRKSSIAMIFDGAPVVPMVSGNASQYLLSWSPPAALQSGQIYTLTVSASDAAFPAHNVIQSLRFKTQLETAASAHKINFQPQGTPPAGYEADLGAGYTLESGKGWDKSGISPKRAGVNSDPRLDTYADRKNSLAKATYSYDVPNGTYRVTFVAGAPNAAGKQRVEVEGNVILNNQTTSAGQFLSISDYAVAIQDGQLDVTIGGAGGSTKTQLCYLEFVRDGSAPPPPPTGGNDPAPRAVAGLQVGISGKDLVLNWNSVSQDTTGALVAVSRYHIYRGATPGFLPDRAHRSNRVGMVSGTTFTDLGALAAPGDHYYIVTGERLSGVESIHASNLGVARAIALAPGAGQSLTTWIALPYSNGYANAKGLVSSMNGGSGAGPVVAVTRLDRTTQLEQTYVYGSGSWGGADFPLLPGEACRVTASAPWRWTVVGSEASLPQYGFAFRTEVSNLSWISLPQNATYTTAQSLVASLNGSSAAAPVTKLAQWDPASQHLDTWLYFAGAWRGTNFAVLPGSGLAVLVSADLPAWSPHLAQP
jgi:hypothetical protein